MLRRYRVSPRTTRWTQFTSHPTRKRGLSAARSSLRNCRTARRHLLWETPGAVIAGNRCLSWGWSGEFSGHLCQPAEVVCHSREL